MDGGVEAAELVSSRGRTRGVMTVASGSLSLWVDADLWRECRRTKRSTPGMSLGRLVEAAIERQLEQWPAYSQRTGDLPTGVPDEARQGSIIRVNVRVDPVIAERWRDAIYWRNLYLSHATEEAIRSYLDE